MVKINKEWTVLFLIFLIVLGSRLYFAFQTPFFNDEAYLNYRLIHHISDTGKPLNYDMLSYNGRDVIISPVFHYILAFFGFFMPLDLALKLIPNIFISLLVFLVYRLSYALIEEKNLSMLLALLSGFVPIVFSETLNNISIYSLVLPLVFYLLYLLIKIREKNNIIKFVSFSFFLGILHPSSFVFLITLIFFVVLMVSESIPIEKIRKEILSFSLLLILFVQFLIYKKAFLVHGFGVIRNNVPVQVLATYFNFSFIETVLKVGILLIIFGLIGIAFGWAKKREDVMILSSLILSTLLLLWFKFLKDEVGLMFIGVALVVISGLSFKIFLKYLDKTKFSKYKNSVTLFSVLILISSLVIPSFLDASKNIQEHTPTEYEILVLNWIKDNALPDVTILAPLNKGHLITALAGKRNVIDDNFLLAPDTSERFKDVQMIYSTKSEVRALDLINKHNVDYILVPIESEIEFGNVRWLDDENCFEGIFFGTPKVYKVLC